jgi:hypothetical protein
MSTQRGLWSSDKNPPPGRTNARGRADSLLLTVAGRGLGVFVIRFKFFVSRRVLRFRAAIIIHPMGVEYWEVTFPNFGANILGPAVPLANDFDITGRITLAVSVNILICVGIILKIQ